MAKKYDFAGYVTKNNMRCSDGVVIKHNAFIDNEGKKVPLVWEHNHDAIENVLGHVILHNDEHGVYGYGYFNGTPQAEHAREVLKHGDIASMSIAANRINKMGSDVVHGNIYEVSLVLSGANPGAFIDTVIAHSDNGDGEQAIIYSDSIIHADTYDDEIEHADEDNEKLIDDVANALTSEELQQVYDKAREMVGDDIPDNQLVGALTKEQIDELSDFILKLVQDEESEEDDEVEHSSQEDDDEIIDDEEEEDLDDENIKHSDDELKSLSKEDLAKVAAHVRSVVGEDVPADEIMDHLSEDDIDDIADFIDKLLNGSSEDEQEEDEMKHNVFNGEVKESMDVLTHSDTEAIFADAKRSGSLKESVLDHTDGKGIMHSFTDVDGKTYNNTYGMANIDVLFPDAKAITNVPEFIKRDTEWVSKVMAGVHHTPFSRIKSVFADITMDEARAKGYVKGNEKAEEVFSLLKRVTVPTTIYKKQKLDRDDIIDITDFDVVAWIKSEMRVMLDEELARAILIGDGRLSSNNDKISESNIRPIATDAALYSVPVTVSVPNGASDAVKAKQFITAAIKNRKKYKGSGNPTLFCTEDILTSCLLLEDKNERVIYDTVEKLATALRVKDIVTVEPMEGAKDQLGQDLNLLAIMVNLADYNVGADKGGAVNLFDDFDIDFNQQKYLIETRCSGALKKPYSAMVFKLEEAQG